MPGKPISYDDEMKRYIELSYRQVTTDWSKPNQVNTYVEFPA